MLIVEVVTSILDCYNWFMDPENIVMRKQFMDQQSDRENLKPSQSPTQAVSCYSNNHQCLDKHTCLVKKSKA